MKIQYADSKKYSPKVNVFKKRLRHLKVVGVQVFTQSVCSIHAKLFRVKCLKTVYNIARAFPM